ncbi:carboxylesterase/lipase family protein [Spirochaeta isovalerica]|uniref:Carboxylic ester hydrolase n=1 Tax=Spirochaeta isovalerica TaxID=150 RepID=A0A841R9R3_9SPIO|nr:carboxylesterase family protein [Spirochaeta isovalerica]MBB6479448.1 para-nitrobenzyl esterase [Spirochaeta isovalerica]
MNNRIIVLTIFLILLSFSGCMTLKVSDLEAIDRNPGWNGDKYVHLDAGWIQGEEDSDETWVWKGIPYAAPPVGDLRWKAPRPVEPWNDVRKTVRFAPKATQFIPLLKGPVSGEEDCLYLNIWRPKTLEQNLPVYVWIHGGGNSIGSSTSDDYLGYALASRSNAVFVSINYRLGPLGWFRHPALQTDNKLDNSGNYGLLDIIAALRWIRDNIEGFGGDPGNVTLSGESAGANNTLALMLSPEADGLFHKAIVQSGYRRSVSTGEAEKHSMDIAAYLIEKNGLEKEQLSSEEIKKLLLESSPKDLFKFYEPGITGMIDNPYHIEDGFVFPEGGFSRFDTGDYPNKVPMIVGSNKDEMKMFLFFDSTIDWKSDLYQYVSEIGSLRFKEEGVDSIAAAINRNSGPPVYAYRFDWGSPDEEEESPLPGKRGQRLGAFHTLEIPFFLGLDTINGSLFTSLVFNRHNEEGRRNLTGTIMDYTANFIWNGSPDRGRPVPLDWPVWDEENRYLVFNTKDDKAVITTDDKIITRDERLNQLKSELGPGEYAELLERTE